MLPGPERRRVIDSPLLPISSFLMAPQSKTRVTSVKIKAMSALAIESTSNRKEKGRSS